MARSTGSNWPEDWSTATVTHESGIAARIDHPRDAYHAYLLNMSAETGSMRHAVDIAIDLIQEAMKEDGPNGLTAGRLTV